MDQSQLVLTNETLLSPRYYHSAVSWVHSASHADLNCTTHFLWSLYTKQASSLFCFCSILYPLRATLEVSGLFIKVVYSPEPYLLSFDLGNSDTVFFGPRPFTLGIYSKNVHGPDLSTFWKGQTSTHLHLIANTLPPHYDHYLLMCYM